MLPVMVLDFLPLFVFRVLFYAGGGPVGRQLAGRHARENKGTNERTNRGMIGGTKETKQTTERTNR